MGFSGFSQRCTYEMAIGKSANSLALQSKKTKKYPKPPNKFPYRRLNANGHYIDDARRRPHSLPKQCRATGFASHVERVQKCCTPYARRQSTDTRITPDKKVVIGRDASTGAP
jgi:hypothetical protein